MNPGDSGISDLVSHFGVTETSPHALPVFPKLDGALAISGTASIISNSLSHFFNFQ